MDCYRDMADVERTFLEFMDRVPFYGAATAGIDNSLLKAILPRARRRVFTYGTDAEADFRVELLPGNGSGLSRFHVHTCGETLGPFDCTFPAGTMC